MVAAGLIRSIRPLQSIHFAVMTIGGSALAYRHLGRGVHGLDIKDGLPVVLAAFGILMVWQFTVMINDIFDLPIDIFSNPDRPLVRGDLSTRTYAVLGAGCGAAALIAASFLGLFASGLMGVCLALGILYSAPPFRLRMTMTAPVIIGLGSGLAFLLGHSAAGGEAWDTGAIRIAALICAALALGSTVKDYKDYEGDRRAGVRTLFTVFGIAKGKKCASGAVVASFLLPLVLVHRPWDIVVYIMLGALTARDFTRHGSMNRVMGGYFVALIYTALRYF